MLMFGMERTRTGRRLLRAYGLSPYLDQKGWFRSVEERMPVSADGSCLPWYTYPMISFLTGRITPDLQVFEYGSGNSTLWWGGLVSGVTSCEHDRQWHDRLKPRLPPNVHYVHCELDEDGRYCQTILASATQFDCIIIDGRDRVNCARRCLPALKPDGVILWDNTEREAYQDGFSHLSQCGFRRLDFWGLGPINTHEWCTSLFYRAGNRFGV